MLGLRLKPNAELKSRLMRGSEGLWVKADAELRLRLMLRLALCGGLRLRLSGAKHSFSGFRMLKEQREGFNMDKIGENNFWENLKFLTENFEI